MSLQRGSDVLVIGGGFYGACLALYLRACGLTVTIVEREQGLLTRASYVNQARIHNGYHYPRNFLTAVRSRRNFSRFLRDFPYAVHRDFVKLYAVASHDSKVTAQQFYDFCLAVGAPIREASPRERALFDHEHIEQVFEVQECAFDAVHLREGLAERLHEAQVDIAFGVDVKRVFHASGESLIVESADGRRWGAEHVFACVYADLNALLQRSALPCLPLKHELAEIALVRPAPALGQHGITVVDGPFFSTMPFPSSPAASFSHVRYTPHKAWRDDIDVPPRIATGWQEPSQFVPMVRDAARFVPAVADTTYVSSLFTAKTTLAANEEDDGRPILLRRDHGLSNFHVVMGGKIDNIYDLISALADFSGQRAGAIVETNDPFFEELFNGAERRSQVAAGRKEHGHRAGGDRAARGAAR